MTRRHATRITSSITDCACTHATRAFSYPPIWQALSDAKVAEAVRDLRDGYSLEEKVGEITVLRDLIAKLPEAFLLKLGNEKEVKNAKQPTGNRQYYATLERNLITVVSVAFPACVLKEHETQRTTRGKRFQGRYFDGLCSSNS